MANRNSRLTPKALGAKAATLEAERAKRRTFIVAGTIAGREGAETVHTWENLWIADGGR
jgi:hypothetical protein